MKPVVSSIMRKDCTRDNRKVPLPNASFLGFGIGHAKRGCWITFTKMTYGSVGRVVGRVVCEGKDYVEVIALSHDLQSCSPQWVEPANVQTCVRHSPLECMAFMLGEWSEPADIIYKSEQGFIRDAADTYSAVVDAEMARKNCGTSRSGNGYS